MSRNRKIQKAETSTLPAFKDSVRQYQTPNRPNNSIETKWLDELMLQVPAQPA